MRTLSSLTLAAVLAAFALEVRAQDNAFKVGITRYDTDSRTNGISGISVPPGADAKFGDATTVVFDYERMISPNLGIEFVLGIPPTVKARATGTVAFLGDEVLSAKNPAPTLLLSYHFGSPGDTWRPHLGAGVNYTHFTHGRSSLASDVKLGDSTGLALQPG